jgi:hypothetical protein
MRGGRKIDRRGASTGKEDAIPIPVVIVFAGFRVGVADGRPRNRQHEHMPLHSSCVMGTGRSAAGC